MQLERGEFVEVDEADLESFLDGLMMVGRGPMTAVATGRADKEPALFTPEARQSFIGPHEGRELELMQAGEKPLSMFVQSVPSEFDLFPEEQFDRLVAEGKLIRNVSLETLKVPGSPDAQIRRVLYALPHEEWRIKSILLIHELYHSLLPGWRPDLDRAIGLLLGYEREDIERFLESKAPGA
jgi:hypothetical protein